MHINFQCQSSSNNYKATTLNMMYAPPPSTSNNSATIIVASSIPTFIEFIPDDINNSSHCSDDDDDDDDVSMYSLEDNLSFHNHNIDYDVIKDELDSRRRRGARPQAQASRSTPTHDKVTKQELEAMKRMISDMRANPTLLHQSPVYSKASVNILLRSNRRVEDSQEEVLPEATHQEQQEATTKSVARRHYQVVEPYHVVMRQAVPTGVPLGITSCGNNVVTPSTTKTALSSSMLSSKSMLSSSMLTTTPSMISSSMKSWFTTTTTSYCQECTTNTTGMHNMHNKELIDTRTLRKVMVPPLPFPSAA